MLRRTKWRVVEEPCEPGEARKRWASARVRGAVGAVTSWGAGIGHRKTIRLYWEVHEGDEPPEGEDLVEENWTPHWRATLRPVPVTDRLTLVPTWLEPPEGAPEPLKIDPGMAFGAGDHPTTRLCVRCLARDPLAGVGVLDVGTGTGVLALAAARFGAPRVDALDIDPFGFAACRRNIRLNDLDDRVTPVLVSLDLWDGSYPLVLANIVAGQPGALAVDLRRLLAPGGRLVVSGFESPKADEVVRGLGLRELRRFEEDGWAAVELGGGA